ncbi:unnamed protein product [Diabrotica balteata]|uniref:Uncharacterized protein n=1 Tax=Diabrotica balteata TaxID=107213 RepID=A0A9N9X746_DIABA|nr:unnamed protein product [Diabrotica balteata]
MSSRLRRIMARGQKEADQQIVQEAAYLEDLSLPKTSPENHSLTAPSLRNLSPSPAFPKNLSPPATSTDNLSPTAASPEYLNPPAVSPENPHPSTFELQGIFQHLSSTESDPFDNSEESYRPSDDHFVIKNVIYDNNSSDNTSSDNSLASDAGVQETNSSRETGCGILNENVISGIASDKVVESLNRIKNGKGVGANEISVKVWKALGNEGANILLQMV